VTTPQILVAASAVVIGSLGFAHLVLTYWGPKLLPRDRSLKGSMESTHLVITRQTTLWRAWIGFNVSHSMGALLFGLLYGYLALAQGDLLFESFFLQAIGLATLAAYVVLAKLYWFITPLLGASVALACFLAGVLLAAVA
jgi:hypothetical protein